MGRWRPRCGRPRPGRTRAVPPVVPSFRRCWWRCVPCWVPRRPPADLGGRRARRAGRPRRRPRARRPGPGAHAPVRAPAVDARPLGHRRHHAADPARRAAPARARPRARACPRRGRTTPRRTAARRAPRGAGRSPLAPGGPGGGDVAGAAVAARPRRGRHARHRLLGGRRQPARGSDGTRTRHGGLAAGVAAAGPARPAGRRARRPRARVAPGPRRAAAAGDVAAARLAAEQERSRRLEDRARLARELHDSVGHGVTLMVLQAGAARATPGDDGREALAAVERSGRAVMADLHRVLGLLDPSVPDRTADDDARPWAGDTTPSRPPARPGSTCTGWCGTCPGRCPPRWRRSSSGACARR